MDFIAPSGAKVRVNQAGFKQAMNLKAAIAKEIAHSDMDFSLDSVDMQSIDAGEVVKLLCLIDSSESVYSAVFDCLTRCTYDGHKITEATFEPDESRQDYYEIVSACIKVNLAPFLSGLLSRLKPSMEAFMASQKVSGHQ